MQTKNKQKVAGLHYRLVQTRERYDTDEGINKHKWLVCGTLTKSKQGIDMY